MDIQDKIYVAGHRGMVGSAMVRLLYARGFRNLLLRTSQELDLTRQAEVERFLQTERPDVVVDAAARVGGIKANSTYRAEFIARNLQIQTNLIHGAHQAGVRHLLFFSSSCVYPRLCPQPMKEAHLWSGPPEPTNEPYAVAKLAGMSMCRAYNEQYGTHFLSVIPTNLYGPHDNYDPEQSHVMAALILKMHMAKCQGRPAVSLWGTGTPRRELLYVDDAVAAALHVLEHYEGLEPVNIGTGADVSIRELAETVQAAIGYKGSLEFDASKPDGAPQKLLDISRLRSLNWQPRVSLRDGIREAYGWFLSSPAAQPHTS